MRNRSQKSQETKMTLRYWLGERVCIKESKIECIIIKITFEGSTEEALLSYRVRYWINGELYEVNLSEEELDPINKHDPICIGFHKQGE